MAVNERLKHIVLVAVGGCMVPLSGCADEGANDVNPAMSEDSENPAVGSSEPCEFLFANEIEFDEYYPDIYFLYVSPSSSSAWGPDQLGSSVLSYGEQFLLNDVPQGIYDIQAVDEDDYTYSRFGVVCPGGAFRWDITADDED